VLETQLNAAHVIVMCSQITSRGRIFPSLANA
jgi:hypothetical protein